MPTLESKALRPPQLLSNDREDAGRVRPVRLREGPRTTEEGFADMEGRIFHKAPPGSYYRGVWTLPDKSVIWEWTEKKNGGFLTYKLYTKQK